MESTNNRISINYLSEKPTQAYGQMKQRLKRVKVDSLSPNSPINDDKLRFVCISDTHTKLNIEKVPFGDVLLHAGDFTNIGLPKEVIKFNEQMGCLPHNKKIVIAGNHELSFEPGVSETYKCYYDDKSKNENRLLNFLQENKYTHISEALTNCCYLNEQSTSVCGIKIFGSPWQPTFCDWAFNANRGQDCLNHWNKIPTDTDILMTHGPPIGFGDRCWDGQRAGCVELLTTVQEVVKPKFHVFGHIHEGYGVTSDGITTFINASICTKLHRPTNDPIVFDVSIPQGHSKQELNLPTHTF